MWLHYSEKITNVSMYDKQGHVRTLTALMPGKAPGLMLYDDGIRAMVELTSDAADKPIIRLNDPATRESQTLKGRP